MSIYINNNERLKELFPSLNILDENTWKKCVSLREYGLSVDDVEPLDCQRAVQEIQKLYSENAGVTLFTVPRGLDLEKVRSLVGNPIHILPISHFELPIIPVEKTYRVVMTNSVLTGSRELPNHPKECELPDVLTAVTLPVLKRLYSTSRSLMFDLKPFIRCAGDLVVGSSSGYSLIIERSSIIEECNLYTVGFAIQKRL